MTAVGREELRPDDELRQDLHQADNHTLAGSEVSQPGFSLPPVLRVLRNALPSLLRPDGCPSQQHQQ